MTRISRSDIATLRQIAAREPVWGCRRPNVFAATLLSLHASIAAQRTAALPQWLARSALGGLLCWLATPSLAALLISLDRLEDAGLVRSELGREMPPERGGRPRRYYGLTDAGRRVADG
jgi:hypothetical protein